VAELALVLPRAYCFAIAIIVHHRYRAESLRTSKDLKGQCHIICCRGRARRCRDGSLALAALASWRRRKELQRALRQRWQRPTARCSSTTA
jgi:hypothetical protein